MFSETLRLNLDLAVKNDIFKIPGGSIKNFQLKLDDYGFCGKADFWISSDVAKDTLFPKFTLLDAMETRLSIRGVYNVPSPAPEPLRVKGPVTWKSVREVAVEEVAGKPVLFRHYTIHFRDAAQVLWGQHFPTMLYEKAKMADVIEAQVVKGISLQMDWDILEKEQPMICLSLGETRPSVSFYDFLIWYVASENGVFNYDSQEQAYRLSKTKHDGGREVSILPREVEKLRVHLPETCRHNVRVLNADAEKPKTQEVARQQAVAGTRHDVILRTPLVSSFDHRSRLEAAKLQNRDHQIELTLKQFPEKTFRTGSLVHFDKKAWSKKIVPYGRKYRVCRIQIDGKAAIQEPQQELATEFCAYNVDMTAGMETRDSPHVDLPPFKPPRYPIQVEGKIISEIGEETDKTYQISADGKTSQDFYSVHVPLWNKEIRIPFVPDLVTGHFYFPAFKHSRVLLDLYFDHAEIERFLDWGKGVRLPMETHGNHILMGKNDVSQISLQHVYRDDKPVFTIERTLGVDTEIIQLKEGVLVLETKDDESKKAREERYDLTPRVAAARSKLASETEAAISELTADFQATQTEVTGQLTRALTEVKAQLEAMDQEISAKVDEFEAKIEVALQQLSKQISELKNRTASTKAELKEKQQL